MNLVSLLERKGRDEFRLRAAFAVGTFDMDVPKLGINIASPYIVEM